MHNFNMFFRPTYYLTPLVILATVLAGCSGSKYEDTRKRQLDRYPPNETSLQKSIDDSSKEEAKSAEQVTAPWQVWREGLTLNGLRFKDSRVISADSLISQKNYTTAILEYRSARPSGSDEAESLAIRISSVALLSGDAPNSILSLSKFFQSRKQEETQVTDIAALFFGFAYGQARNYEQALAWFYQALKSKKSNVRDQASNGLSALLRIIPTASFEELALIWRPNETISKIISEERFLRQTRAVLLIGNSTYFWAPASTLSSTESTANLREGNPESLFTNQSTRKVAALLPLSGRYSKMGAAIKSGLELAAELSITRGSPLEFTFKDFPGSSDVSESGVESNSLSIDDMVAQGASIIVGPLLSEQAAEVEISARRNSVPAIILAKGGNASLGEGIYRFGLTNESQANSLVSAIVRFRQNPRIALLYPSDESGLGFIRSVQEALKLNNIKPLYELSYSKGDSASMLAHVPELELNPPEFIIFADNLKAATQFFSAFSSSTRKSIIPVGSALWDNPIEVMQSKTILSGAIFVSAFYPDLSKPLVSEFIAHYKEKYKKSPDFFAAQGYDAGLLLANSASIQNSVFTPAALLDGVTGQARSTNRGEILRELSVLRLTRGSIAPLTELPEVRSSSEYINENKFDDSADETKNVEQLISTDPVVSK